MPAPDQQLAAIESRQIEIREELGLVRSGYSPDAPGELREAELLEEFKQLEARAERLRAVLGRG